MQEPQLGDRITFQPAGFVDTLRDDIPNVWPATVTGTVDYINRAHRFYRVGFEVHGKRMEQCLKF